MQSSQHWVVAILVVLSFVSQARAQDDADARARAHFVRAQALFRVHRYTDAYAEFAAGHGLSGRPLFLFNMAECAREAGDVDGARRDYDRYLEADPNGAMAPTARARRAELAPAEPSP